MGERSGMSKDMNNDLVSPSHEISFLHQNFAAGSRERKSCKPTARTRVTIKLIWQPGQFWLLRYAHAHAVYARSTLLIARASKKERSILPLRLNLSDTEQYRCTLNLTHSYACIRDTEERSSGGRSETSGGTGAAQAGVCRVRCAG